MQTIQLSFFGFTWFLHHLSDLSLIHPFLFFIFTFSDHVLSNFYKTLIIELIECDNDDYGGGNYFRDDFQWPAGFL